VTVLTRSTLGLTAIAFPGLYSIDLSVAPESKDAPVFGAVGVVRGVKVVVTAELSDVAIQVVDALEDEDLEHAYKVAYPEKVAEVIKANPLQHVLVSFRVRSQGRPLPVQQAFVVFRHEESGHEVILPAQLTGNKYKVHLVRLSLSLSTHAHTTQFRSPL
jgi:hypothetical protein